MGQLMKMTEQHMLELSLHGMRENFPKRIKEALDADLSYEDFMNLILFDELEYRKNLRQKRLIRAASFRSSASLEGITYEKNRNFDKKLIQELAQLRFINDGLNVIFHGATGVGKTYIATALGHHACRCSRSVMFFKMNLLMEKIALTRSEGSYLNFLKRVRAVDLLIVDDFGIKNLTASQAQDFYDVLDERDNERATVLTTQLPSENWNEVITDPLVCEAISDRLTARAIKIEVRGPSKRRANQNQSKELTE
ncbi:MAG: ATP-binding protein [Oligoflexia bacterium]|nr:ATP-binding protein [Oligoflexia bacterium]